MKKLIVLAASVCAVMWLSGCKDDDLGKRIDDLENRVERLEEFCRRMNANIGALQSLVDVLSEADRITGIVPLYNGTEKIGYTIAFEKRESVTVFAGKGEVAPVVGVRRDEDDRFYWTLNGVWLLDADHRKLPVQRDADVVPQLKVEDNYWYVSCDGESWTQVGEVSEEEGDGMFRSVSADDEYVYFTLHDGTVLTVPLVGNVVVDAILFEDELVKSICISRWDVDNDGELSVAEAEAVTSLRKAFNAKPIRSLRELGYFTGVTALAESEFCDCDELETVVLPANLETIGDYAFSYCLSLKNISCKSEMPPVLGESVFERIPVSTLVIRVPASAVDAYKAAKGWSDYAEQIEAAE